MRHFIMLAAILLCSCGGGGGGKPSETPVQATVCVVPDNDAALHDSWAWTEWDADGTTRITLSETAAYSTPVARDYLVHELWHALSHQEEHTDEVASVGCLTIDGTVQHPLPSVACASDVEIARGGRRIVLSFEDDPLAAQQAADWWNEAAGYEIVTVAD